MEAQTYYQKAIKFATAKHVEVGQNVPGTDLPYVVHVSNVAMEVIMAANNTEDFDLGFAVQIALLHDTIEDTTATFEEIEEEFSTGIAEAVAALTKDNTLPKEQRMVDSLARIKKLQPEVWAVKLADRITNLQPPPPHWDKEKIAKYLAQAKTILHELKDGNDYLAKRLEGKIEEYRIFR